MSQHAIAIVDGLPRGVTVKTITSIGIPYAVRSQSSWLGWSPDLETELVEWMADNRAATRSVVRARTAEVAERFDQMIRGLLRARRVTPTSDITSELVILEELLGRTSWIEPASDRTAVREKPPVGGWARVPVVLH